MQIENKYGWEDGKREMFENAVIPELFPLYWFSC
jgi:hypothetical protein